MPIVSQSVVEITADQRLH